MAKDLRLAIAVPCFNEGALIKTTSERLLEILDDLIAKEKIAQNSYVIFVDDGSTDNTWLEIGCAIARTPDRIKAVKFSSNFGNQKALLAGMMSARKFGCGAVITIDADLQQDETKIEEFIDKHIAGHELVFGIRNDRKTDGLIKKFTALSFYNVMNMLGVSIPKNHSDFRLVSARVLDVLAMFDETDLFLRGFFHAIGFSKDFVYFNVKPRKVGKSKFNLISLMALAINGITSYSIVPLKLICVLGFLMMGFGLIAGGCAIFAKLMYNDSPDGWATSIILTSFFGGIQVFCIGIVAEYLGQIFREVKNRPRYIVEQELS